MGAKLDPHGHGARARAHEVVTLGEAFFLVRLSRQRFIPRSRKTNGKIVSKILTAHLGEHVLASRGISLPLSLSLLSSPPLLHVYATGVRDKVKGVSVWRGGGGGGGVWTGKKKFSSYPLGENAVPKLVARFVTESSRETRSSPGNCRPGTGLSQLLAFDQLSPSLVLHHLSNLWFWIDFFDFFFRPFFFLSLRREIGRIRDWTQTFRKFFPTPVVNFGNFKKLLQDYYIVSESWEEAILTSWMDYKCFKNIRATIFENFS